MTDNTHAPEYTHILYNMQLLLTTDHDSKMTIINLGISRCSTQLRLLRRNLLHFSGKNNSFALLVSEYCILHIIFFLSLI